MKLHKAGIALASLAIAAACYLALRPMLAANAPDLRWIEFPIALLAAGLVMHAALRVPRARRVPAPQWRRHEQVVRALPDAERVRLAESLDAWTRSGEGADEAIRILALATERDPTDISAGARAATTQRQRVRFIRDILRPGA